MTARNALRHAIALLAATLVTALAGSVVQTQINLSAIGGMGVEVPLPARLATTGEDLLRFGPVMALIALAAFAPAFAVAGLAARPIPGARAAALVLAGAAGLWTAFYAMGFVSPMPTLVAAVRGTAGLAAMCATGLAGGAVYAALSRRPAGLAG